MLNKSGTNGLILLSVVLFLTVAFKRSDLNSLLIFSGGSSANVTAKPSNSAKSWSSNQPSNQDVLQIRVYVVLPVPADWHSSACHEGLRDLFLTRYKSEQQFRMSLQGLGSDMWRLEGRVLFNKPCKLRSARKRIVRAHARDAAAATAPELPAAPAAPGRRRSTHRSPRLRRRPRGRRTGRPCRRRGAAAAAASALLCTPKQLECKGTACTTSRRGN